MALKEMALKQMAGSKNRSVGILGGFIDYLSPIGNVTIHLFHDKMNRVSLNFTKLNKTFYPIEDYFEGVAMYGVLIITIVLVLLLTLLVYSLVILLAKPKCPKFLCCLKYFIITTVVVSNVFYIIELLGWIILHEDLLYLKKKYIEPTMDYINKIAGMIPLVYSYLEWVTTMTGAMYLAGQAAGTGNVEKLINKTLYHLSSMEMAVTSLQMAAHSIWMFQRIIMICGIVILAWCMTFFCFFMIWPIIKQWNRFLCGVVIGAVVAWIFWSLFFLIVFPITMMLSDFCYSLKIVTHGYNGIVKEYMDYFFECKGENPLGIISDLLSALTSVTGAVTSIVMPGLSAVAGFVTGGALTGESVTKMQDEMSLLSDYTEILRQINCNKTSVAYRDITKYLCSNILVGLSMCLFSTFFVLIFLYAYLLTGVRIKGFLTFSCEGDDSDEKEPNNPSVPPSNPKIKTGKPKKPEKEQKETVGQEARIGSGEPVAPCGNICPQRGYAAQGKVAYPEPTYKDNTKRFHKEFACSVDVTPWIR